MRAGTLTETITVLNPKVDINDVGEQITEYKEVYTTKANVTHSTGNRNVENTEVVYNYSKTFRTRYYLKISEFDRILWNNKQYRILSIEPNKQYQELIITAELINE